MKLSAVIVLYNPDYLLLKKNILSILNDVDSLFLWQNSLINDIHGYLSEIIDDKIHIVGNGTNIGISGALNEVVLLSQKQDFTHLLTLDQDSFFETGHLHNYKSLIMSCKDKMIGVYAANPYIDKKKVYQSEIGTLELSDAITSGSIFPMEIFKLFGLFKKELFIDAVDYEFCYRIRDLGDYKTLLFTDIKLHHVVGYTSKTRLGFKTVNYSAFRTYYIVRNQIYMWRLYPDLFPYSYKITLIKHHIFFRFFKIMLGEKEKFPKIRALFFGVFDGLANRNSVL